MKLTASLILRDELSRYLAPCIESLLTVCDEIRVLDDGSTDGWEETLRPTWGDDGARVKVHRHVVDARQGEPAFHLHAAARNRLLQFTLADDPGWVAAIDADEFITDGAAVRRACEGARADVVSVEIAEVWEACDELLCVRQDGGWRAHQIGCVWRAQRFAKQALALADRGHATGRVPDAVHHVRSTPSGAALLHFGWANLAERQERYDRYAVGDGGRFHAAAHIKSIMWADRRVQLEGRDWPDGWPGDLRAAVRERAILGEVTS